MVRPPDRAPGLHRFPRRSAATLLPRRGRLGTAEPPPAAGSCAWGARKGLLSAPRAPRTPSGGRGRNVGPRAGKRRKPSPRAFPGYSQRPAICEPAAGRPGQWAQPARGWASPASRRNPSSQLRRRDEGMRGERQQPMYSPQPPSPGSAR